MCREIDADRLARECVGRDAARLARKRVADEIADGGHSVVMLANESATNLYCPDAHVVEISQKSSQKKLDGSMVPFVFRVPGTDMGHGHRRIKHNAQVQLTSLRDMHEGSLPLTGPRARGAAPQCTLTACPHGGPLTARACAGDWSNLLGAVDKKTPTRNSCPSPTLLTAHSRPPSRPRRGLAQAALSTAACSSLVDL